MVKCGDSKSIQGKETLSLPFRILTQPEIIYAWDWMPSAQLLLHASKSHGSYLLDQLGQYACLFVYHFYQFGSGKAIQCEIIMLWKSQRHITYIIDCSDPRPCFNLTFSTISTLLVTHPKYTLSRVTTILMRQEKWMI